MDGGPYALTPVSPSSSRPSPPPPGAASKWGLVAERLLDLASGFSDVLARVQALVRRLLELHVFKLVALYTVWVALKEVRTGRTPCPRVQRDHLGRRC